MNTPAPTLKHNWIWLDLETTGLDPRAGYILEIGIVLARDAKGDDFSVVEEGAFVPDYGGELDAVLATCDDYVRRMHTDNGLIAELRDQASREEGGESIADLDSSLAAWCVEDLQAAPRSLSLAGASVHFDLAWIRVHLPAFAAFLSHRVLDVSTLKAFERAQGEPFEGVEGRARPHRAIPDILASLDEARQLRDRRWL